MVRIQFPTNPNAANSPRQPRLPASRRAAAPSRPVDLFGAAGAEELEPLILPFTVLCDNRERSGGWRFQGMIGDSKDKYRPLIVPQRECYMVTADYTIEGVPVFIERKAHEDYIGSVGGGHLNFRKEHERMRDIIAAGGKCFVVCESSYDRIMDELNDPTCLRDLDSATVEGVVASWPGQFGVPHIFAGTRAYAERLCLKLLRTWYTKLTQ